VLAAAGLALAACGASGSGTTTSNAKPAPAASADQNLAGTCPATVVVQMAWTPEAEHGAIYHLVGPNHQIDANRKRVTGPLVAGGRDTGVKIEVRAGGPAIGFQNAASQMYADPDVMLGEVATDDAVGLSAKQPVLAVMAPFDKAPYMLQWDPKQHPDFHSIIDIGKTKTTVLYFNGAMYMEYLIGSGILRRDQVDGSYDGSPARWLSEGGKIVQQGFATNEPYVYGTALPQWKKPVDFQLVHDTGYPIYPEAVVVRPDRKAQYATCLKKLVPLLQRAQAEFVADPGPTVDLIVKANEAFKGFPYPREQALFSVEQQRKLGIVGNGGNATVGDFDPNRIKTVLDIVTPILSGQRKEVKAGLTPDDLYTNEFIDQSIGLK
jgi:hypothetical protein